MYKCYPEKNIDSLFKNIRMQFYHIGICLYQYLLFKRKYAELVINATANYSRLLIILPNACFIFLQTWQCVIWWKMFSKQHSTEEFGIL